MISLSLFRVGNENLLAQTPADCESFRVSIDLPDSTVTEHVLTQHWPMVTS